MPEPPAFHRLPSRRLTAALAAATLLAGAGVGAALPARSASNRDAAARSALTASLLGAVAADRSAAASAPKETSQPGPSGPAAATVSGSASKKGKRTRAANAGAGRQSSAASAEAGPEAASEAASEEASSEESAPESASSPAGSGSGSHGSGSQGAPAPVSPALLSQITHVWVISLSGGSFEEALNHRDLEPYLTGQLLPKGTLLTHYSLVAASPLANDLALISGQGPNPDTERDCPSYTALTPVSVAASGLASGSGCVYPASVQTLADQVTTAALSWRAYMQDMAPAGVSGQATGAATCRHPQLGAAEPSASPSPGEDYLVSRNPFVYFDSLIESHACEKDDVDLSALSADLATPSQTPALSWIAPSACDDGSQPACGGAGPGGLAGADAFLKQIVPQILATAAYREHGLILLTFDSGPPAASAGAASTQRSARGVHAAKAPQGARVGALIVSPFANAGAKTSEAFDTYSLLRSLEHLFGVPLLGHAADQGVAELGAQVYRSTSNTTAARSAARHGSLKGGG